MKKQVTVISFAVLITAAVALTAANTQQGKDKDQKKEQQDKGKGNDKADKGNQGKNDDKGQRGGKGNQGNNDDKGNQGKGKNNNDNNANESNGKGNNGKRNGNGNGNNDNKGKNDESDVTDLKDLKWDRETFKNRDKIRKQDKVTICHKTSSGQEPAVTIKVSANATKAHMNHGDMMGDCPAVATTNFSDNFLRKRTDYYNDLQNSYEQVTYSQSILDYAVSRLAASKQQLNTMQNANMPAADIERKQTAVNELAQNVTLLEALVGGVAAIVVNKIAN